jgi:uncharacterized membrane protein YdjX (TVP38/TMEM64 family)
MFSIGENKWGNSHIMFTSISAMKRNRWLRLALLFVCLIAISFGIAYLFQKLLLPLKTTLDEFAWLAYLIVFAATLLSSLTIVAPVPIAATLMIAAAAEWNPVLVSLSASIGGAFGELSGYYAGYLGKKILIGEYTKEYDRVASWINRYGFWAISFLAFQPVLPFDVAGLIAGSLKMPLWKFLPALWVGKFPKFIILCYFGTKFIHFLP